MAILQADFDVEDRLDRQSVHESTVEYSEAWRRADWKGAAAHLALILDWEDKLRWLGRARGGRVITSRDRIVNVTEVLDLGEPVSLDSLADLIEPRHRNALDRYGILPPGGAQAVRAALLRLMPGLEPTITALERQAPLRFPRGRRGEILSMERDGVGMVLEMADMSRAELRQWRLTDVDPEPPFLAGLPPSVAIEDAQIAYDVERFRDWTPSNAGRVEWRVSQRALAGWRS